MLHDDDKIKYRVNNWRVKYDEGEIPLLLGTLIFDSVSCSYNMKVQIKNYTPSIKGMFILDFISSSIVNLETGTFILGSYDKLLLRYPRECNIPQYTIISIIQ